jgi:hypothetical protein
MTRPVVHPKRGSLPERLEPYLLNSLSEGSIAPSPLQATARTGGDTAWGPRSSLYKDPVVSNQCLEWSLYRILPIYM